jgi:hypothetical protein
MEGNDMTGFLVHNHLYNRYSFPPGVFLNDLASVSQGFWLAM